MASFFSLLTPKQCLLGPQGTPFSGARLWTKVSGSNTNKTTFRDADGAVPNTNPIILDSRGEVPFGVYGSTGDYRLILASPNDLTDPPTSPIWGPRDGVAGINDSIPVSVEWQPTGLTPTFISATSFNVDGDKTAIFQPRRRVRCTVGGGDRYATIGSSGFFTTFTAVTLVLDVTASGLDGSLSAVAVGIVTATNTSQPYDSSRGLDIASAGTLTLPANADRFNITGVTTISAFANSWIGRRVYLTHAGVQQLVHSATFVLPGGASFNTLAGDESIWEQINSTPTWKLIHYMSAAPGDSVRVLRREGSTITVVNTLAEVTIASVSVPGMAMSNDKKAHWDVRGDLVNNTGGNVLLTFRIKHGGTVIYQSTVQITFSALARAWSLEFGVMNKGVSNSQSGNGTFQLADVSSPTVGLGSISDTNTKTSCIATAAAGNAIDTTIARDFEVTVQWDTASASIALFKRFATCTLS